MVVHRDDRLIAAAADVPPSWTFKRYLKEGIAADGIAVLKKADRIAKSPCESMICKGLCLAERVSADQQFNEHQPRT